MRILVFGVTGMLGGTLFRQLNSDPILQVHGVMRLDPSKSSTRSLQSRTHISVIDDVLSSDDAPLLQLMTAFRPQIVINCIGWRRLPQSASEAVAMIAVNSQWPHRLAYLSQKFGARLIHFSSDAVFSGHRGNYREEDVPDPIDVYGVSKLLGEPNYPNCLILRTSLIGQSSHRSDQLVDWLLRQKGQVNGYEHAIFSGLPTIEIALIVQKILLRQYALIGTWHLAAAPISKFKLLELIVERYGIDVDVLACPNPVIDRSLDASRFHSATGYAPPPWPELIDRMYRCK